MACFACLCFFMHGVQASDEVVHEFDIPAQALIKSLNVLSNQTETLVLFPYDLVKNRKGNAVKGPFTVWQALKELLLHTGLVGGLSDKGVLMISLAESKALHNEGKKMKSKLPVGILVALASFFVVGASAESENVGDNAGAGSMLEEVVVTGNRLINRNAINEKRETFQVKDSIGENEIGGLAASNAAELLAKVPGVNSFEDLSGEGSGGSTGPEPQLVSVRGIRPALNLVTLDGITLAVASFSDRAQRMDVFPVNLAGRTDVMKTFSSDMSAGAIGGQIDFVTRRGVDFSEPLISVTSESGYVEVDDGVQGVGLPLRFEGLYVGRLTDTIGLAATASYNKREVGKPSQLTRGRSRSINFPGADNVRVVREHRILSESAESERLGFSAKLDYAPDDDTYAWLTGAYNTVDQTINHAKTDVRIPSSARGLTLDANGLSGTLRIDDSGVDFGLGRSAFTEVGEFINESELTLFQGGYEKRLNDDATLLLKAGYSEASNSRGSEYYLFMRRGGVTDVAFDGSNIYAPKLSVISPTPAGYFDPASYNLLYRNLLPEVADEDVLDIAPSISFNADPDDEGYGVKVGLKYKKTDRRYDFGWSTRYDIANETVEGSGFSLSDVFASNSGDLSPPGSSSAFPGFYANIDQIKSQITPHLNDPTQFRLEERDDRNFDSDYTTKETLKAIYFQGLFRSERLQGIAGMRYEHTTTDGTGFRSNAGAFQHNSSSGTTSFLLPSVLINYDLLEDVKLRFGLSRTLGRAAYPQIAPTGETISLGLQNTLSRSNPDLKPRRSTNLDVALEWYFKEDSLISISFFDKRIKDEILVETSNDISIDGVLFDTVTQPVNIGSADLTGVELALVSYFDFLPAPFSNLGVSINSIFIDSTFKTSGTRGEVGFLLFQPDRISNFSLLYTDDKFDVSLTVNDVARLPTAFNPSNANNDRFIDGRTTVGAKFLYYFNENLQIYVNGENLSSEDSFETTGESFLYHHREMGRTVNAGITYTF